MGPRQKRWFSFLSEDLKGFMIMADDSDLKVAVEMYSSAAKVM